MLKKYKLQTVKFTLLIYVLLSVICFLSLPVLSHASVETSVQIPEADSQSTTEGSAVIGNAQPSNTISTGAPVTSAEIKLALADSGETSSDIGTSNEDNTASSDTAATENSSASAATVEDDIPISPSSSNNGFFSSIKLDMQSNSGFAATSIPIEVPLGRKEMTPRVSLNYNSGVKNGWLGVGWMLDVGSIQRNTKRGVDYSGDDFVYTINGASSELVYIGTVGGNREYRTKIEGEFSKYYYDDRRGWMVTAKNGTKYYFGSQQYSRQGDHDRYIFKWCLDRVEDTNGNYMTMKYVKHEGEIYLEEIRYTGNSKGQPALPTTNSIMFILDISNPRTDAYKVYNTHFSVRTAYRLKTIEVRSNSQLVRKYELTYEYSSSTFRSRLKSVTVHGRDGGVLPPVTFTYSEAVNGFGDDDEAIQWHLPPDFNVGSANSSVSYLFNPNCNHYYNNYYFDPRTIADIFDFNGDALPDRVIMDQDNYRDMYVYKNNGNGFDYAPLFVNVNNPSQCQWGCAIINDGATWWNGVPEYGSFNDRRSFDMNGDGMPDAVYWGFWYGYYRGRLWVGTNTGHGYDNFVDWNWQFTSDNWDPLVVSRDKDGNVYQDNIDMNGDGLPDRVTSSTARSDGANYLLVSLNTGGGFSNTAIQWHTPVANVAWKQDVRSVNYEGTYQDIIDMNGDGLPDRVTNGGSDYLKVYLNTGSGFSDTYIQWHTPISNSAWPQYVRSSEKPVFDASTNSMRNSTYQDIIDINGDGLPDRVTSNSSRNGNTLRVYLNIGDGFSDTAIDWHTPVTNSNWKQDVVSSNAAGAHVSPLGWCVPYSGGVYQSIMDITGDGLPDRVTNPMTSTDGYLWVYPSNGPFPDLLTEIDNGLGGITEIEYAPSTEYANTYLPFVQHVVSKVTVYDGKENQSITTFDYAGGYYSAEEREYRGFGYVKRTDTYGTVMETWYHQDDTFKGLIEAQVIKDDPSTGEVYAWIENTYGSVFPYAGTGIVFPFLERRDEYIYDASAADPGTETDYQTRKNNFLNVYTGSRRHIITEFTYDDYGNPESRYEAEDPLQGDERTEYTIYAYDLTNYIVSLPLTKYITDSVDSIKARTSYTYYPDERGNLWKKESWLEGGTNPETIYEYDTAGYGNLWKIRDPKGYATELTYDTATQTFPTVIRNHLGHEIHKVYDSIFIDKVYTETDPNGNITTYEYDEFGRTKKITKPSPYGITEYYYPSLSDPDNTFGNTTNQHIREEAQDRTGALMHFKETYFDGLGRTWKERTGGPGAETIVVTTEYDAKGHVFKKSYPYYEGDPVYETIYYYDPVDRLYYTENPDDTNSSIIYERGRTTFIDANVHKKVTVKDIYGRIVSIEEYTGNSTSTHTLYATTDYEYDVLNNLKKVTDAQENETTIIYDTLSRKKEMFDPDMGHWVYDYDANGNLRYQKDAKNQEIWFEYDELNRIRQKDYQTQKTIGSGDIVYTYDETTSTNFIGRLTTVTDNSGTTKFYYDAVGQITKSVKTMSIDSSTYTTQTQYDPLGRVKKIIYPDLTEVDYTYNGNGNIYQILTGGVPYVTYNEYNALAQPQTVAYGNSVTTQYQYDLVHNRPDRLSALATNSPTEGRLVDLAYDDYDSVGNIEHITDNLTYPDGNSRSRSYKYDDLDRLIEADSPSYGGKLIYQYDKIGNMTYNCKFGHYYYEDENHVHAVTSVRKSDGTLAAEYQYDENGNMIHSHDYGISVSRDFTYDYDNMPTSIVANGGAVVSKYDAFGTRVTKTVPVAGTTKYIGQIYECSSTGCTKYIFSGMQRIAEIDNTGTHYYHTDHLGSSTVLTDVSGAKVQEVSYYPYGEILENSLSNITDYLYTGKEWDAETGLYYYGARYYDPKLARFISADTIVPEPFYPQTLNRYAYAYNNPIVLRDLDGHCADAWSSFTSWVSSGWSSFTSAVGSFVTTVTTAAVSMAANFAATVAVTAVGLATGFNSTAMNSVVSTILGGANALSGAIAGALGGSASLALFGGYGDSNRSSTIDSNRSTRGDTVVDPNSSEKSPYVRETGGGFDLGDFIEGWRDEANFYHDVGNSNKFMYDVKKVAYSLEVGKTQDVAAFYERSAGGEYTFDYSHMEKAPVIYTPINTNDGYVRIFTIYGQRSNGFIVPPTYPSIRQGGRHDF